MSNLSTFHSPEVKGCNEAKELQMDELPDEIINCIFSYLNVNDAIRACISLSSSWSKLVTLNFDVADTHTPIVLRDNFSLFRKYLLYLHNANNIDEFDFCSETKDHIGDADFSMQSRKCDVDEWVNFATSKQDRDEVTTSYNKYDFFTRGVRLGIDSGLNLLTSLFMKRVKIEEKTFDSILSYCQYLEVLILEDSYLDLQKRLKITNSFSSLKHVALRYCTGINEFEVNIAASVSFEFNSDFAVWDNYDSNIAKFDNIMTIYNFTLEVNFVKDDDNNIIRRANNGCKAGLSVASSRLSKSNTCLKSLCLTSIKNVSAEFLESLMIHFPFLEHLVLKNMLNLVKMKITSSLCRLKHVSIEYCPKLEKLEIHLLDVVSLELIGLLNFVSSWDDNNAILLEFAYMNPSVYSPLIRINIDYCVQGTNHHLSNIKCKDTTTNRVDNSNHVFSLLKILHLKDISISGKLLEFLLSRFPLLKQLIVTRSRCLVSLKITEESSKSLRHLRIRGCKKLKQLQIHAPNLTTLDLLHNKKIRNVLFGCVPALLNVCYSGILSCGSLSKLKQFSAQLTKLHLHTKLISEDVITAIPSFDNVRKLVLVVKIERHQNLVPIASFAEACPQLHEFKLQIKWDCICDIMYYESSDSEEIPNEGELMLDDVQQWLGAQEDVLSSCRLPQLKSFELVGAFQYERHIDYEYSLVLYIIKNAIQLEKFIFNITDSCIEEYSYDHLPEYLELVKDRQTDAAQQLAKVMPSNIDVQII